MKNLEIDQIYEIYSTKAQGVCTDTRNIGEGSMFFALRGETFNGNDFAVAALEGGAAFAVVDEAHVEALDTERIILVDNVLETLQQVARTHRKKFKIPVLSLTGTNGKTTTKELISAALRTKLNIVATEGNLNNHIGVPLTLLRINEQTQAAVIEMGASNPGEIELLARISCPSFGLITNVGKAHLQGFGSLQGVMQTKGELYDNLMQYKKIAFVNVDNPILMEMVSYRPNLQIVPYGARNDGAYAVPDKDGSPFLTVVVPNPCFTAVNDGTEPEHIVIKTNLIGNYNIDNVLAALCVATYMDIPTADAVAAISAYKPSNNRSQLTVTEKNTLIVDAYNANPTSMSMAIDNFATLNLPDKILLLGDMLELGEDSVAEHKGILKLALRRGFRRIFLVGGEFEKAYAQMCGEEDLSGAEIKLFADSNVLKDWLLENPVLGASVLIKGSRGKRLERTLEAL